MSDILKRIVLLLTLSLVAGGVTAATQAADPNGGTNGSSSDDAWCPTDAEKVGDEALARLAAWKTSAAESYLETKREEFESTAEYRTAAAVLTAESGDREKALQELNQVSKTTSGDPAPAYWRGEVLYWQKSMDQAYDSWDEALRRASAAVEKDPTNARAQYYLGASLIRDKRFDDARKPLKKAKRLGFDPVLANYQLGLSFAFAESWQQAIDAFDAVLAEQETFAPAYFYRGIAWGETSRPDKMVADMERFVELAPQAAEADRARSIVRAAGG